MAYSKIQIETIWKNIMKEIESGKSLRSILRADGMPDRGTIYNWIDSDVDKHHEYYKIFCKSNKQKSRFYGSNIKGSRSIGLNDYRNENATNTNKRKYPFSSIYIIQIQNSSFHKIGVSQNISRRHRDLESASPFVMDILICKQVANAYDLEKYLHSNYSEQFIKSEWFTLNDKQLLECKETISKWEENINGLVLPKTQQLTIF